MKFRVTVNGMEISFGPSLVRYDTGLRYINSRVKKHLYIYPEAEILHFYNSSSMRLHHVYPFQSILLKGMSWDFPSPKLVTWSTQQRFILHRCRLIKPLLAHSLSWHHCNILQNYTPHYVLFLSLMQGPGLQNELRVVHLTLERRDNVVIS